MTTNNNQQPWSDFSGETDPHIEYSDAADPYRAIENLLYMYAERIDRGDFEGVAALFRHAQIYSPSVDQTASGYDQVLAMYSRSTRRYEDGTPKTRHIISNPIIELEPLSADKSIASRGVARSCFTVFQAVEGLTLQPIISGRYLDYFYAEQGQWRFRHRTIMPELFGDLGKHLLFDASAMDW